MTPGRTRSQQPGKTARADWSEIARRLDAARAALERTFTPAPEEARRILAERAAALARPSAAAPDQDERIEVVEFVLARERYALAAGRVRELHPLENLTPLPCTPAYVLGIVNLRGEILSVIDLKKFFDLPDAGLTDLDKLIVLQSESMRLGILADAVAGVRSLPRARIQPPLPTLTGIREVYLLGVTPDRVAVLDADRLLADPALIVHEQVPG